MISCGMLDEQIAALALAHRDKVLARNIALVRRNLDLLIRWIGQNPHFSFVRPQAGTTALVEYDFDLPSVEFCKGLFRQTGAFVTPGACFEMEHCFRMGYACGTTVLEQGLEKLAAYAEGL